MKKTLSILLLWMIGNCQELLCQIIPYQYMVVAESSISQYAEYDRAISYNIAMSLTEHVDMAEESLMDSHEASTTLILEMLAHPNDSINVTYLLHRLNEERLSLRDSLASLLPLRLQAQQIQYMAENKILFPVQSSLEAKMFFSMDGSGSDSRLMSHNFFSYNTVSEKFAIYSELFSDYFGPVRFGFGALVTGGENEANKRETLPPNAQDNVEALQRLLNGGGNSVISLAYPLIQWRDAAWTRGIRILAAPKYALDIPALGSSVDRYSANADMGIEASAHWAGHSQNIALFFQTRIGYVIGNRAFKDSLRCENNFMVTQMNFGIAFRNTFKLSYSIHNISNDQIGGDLPGFISFSLIPQF